jgi:hypothetical protein
MAERPLIVGELTNSFFLFQKVVVRFDASAIGLPSAPALAA